MSFRERMEEEDRNQRFEDERRAEREREHAPAYEPPPPRDPTHGVRPEPPDGLRLEQFSPSTSPEPVLLLVVQVPHGSEGKVVNMVAREAACHSVTLMLWTRRPRRRQRRGMKLLFGRRLAKRLTP